MTVQKAEPKLPPIFNPVTRRAHRRQMFWQVSLPLFGGLLLSGVLFAWLLAGGAGSIERGAQVAVIFLAMPMILGGLGLLALILIANSGVGRLIRWLPGPAQRAQRIAAGISRGTQKTADLVAKPFVALDSWGTSLRKLFKRRW